MSKKNKIIKGKRYIDVRCGSEMRITVLEHNNVYKCFINTHCCNNKPFTTIFNALYTVRLSINKAVREMQIDLVNPYSRRAICPDKLKKDALASKEFQLEEINDALDKLLKIREHIATPEELKCIYPNNLGKTSRELTFEQKEVIAKNSAIEESFKDVCDTRMFNVPNSVIYGELPCFVKRVVKNHSRSYYEILDKLPIRDSFYNEIKNKKYVESIPEFSNYATSDDKLYFSISYNKFLQLLTSDSTHYPLSNFMSNMLLFVEYDNDYLPLCISCSKIKIPEIPGYDYEVTLYLVPDLILQCNSPIKDLTMSEFNNIILSRFITYLFNSSTKDILVSCLDMCSDNCKLYSTNTQECLLNSNKKLHTYCKYSNDKPLSSFVYSPEKLLNVIGYIQAMLENRHNMSKTKNNCNKDKYTNDKDIVIYDNIEDENETFNSSNSMWITINEYAEKRGRKDKTHLTSSLEHSKHNSPCEHYRSAHTRVLKNGKIVQVRSTVVNKGKSKALYKIN